MYYARIVDGRVFEVIAPLLREDGTAWPIEERFHPDFVAQLTTYDPANPPPEPESDPQTVVPSQVTMRQAQLALLDAGLLETLIDTIAALPAPEKLRAEIEMRASTVERSSPFLASMAAALNLDDQAVDALFLAASRIV